MEILKENTKGEFIYYVKDALGKKNEAVKEKIKQLIIASNCEKLSFADLRSNTESILKDIKGKFFSSDFYKSMADDEKKAYELLLGMMNTNTLLACAIHESSPGNNPMEKIKKFSEMLDKYGTLFTNCLPSGHDKAFSIGMYQLTERAARQAHKFGKEIGVETPISLTKYNSVNDHIKGAVLLNINNIVYLVNKAKSNKIAGGRNLSMLIELLESNEAKNKGTFVAGIIGLMHNRPANYKYIMYFLENGNHRGDIVNNALQTSFSSGIIRKRYFESVCRIYEQLTLGAVAMKQ
ncbi:MAG: hypothetical protein ACP5H8_00725 [Candidatus Micrarchaeia archaeon]